MKYQYPKSFNLFSIFYLFIQTLLLIHLTSECNIFVASAIKKTTETFENLHEEILNFTSLI